MCLPVLTQEFNQLIRGVRDRAADSQPELPVTVRVQGHDADTWKGRLLRLPESEAKEMPLALTTRGGGPVAIKGGVKSQTLVPQTQYYLVYVEIQDPNRSISPGSMAQVKIHCKAETVAHWLWRKINDLFDLGLI